MAENKKSIVVYADWIDKFEELEDDEAGRLIKHFFRYVNDLNPEAPDRTTKLMFIDIEATLKRDLVKWEKRAERSRENGLKGGRPTTQENPEKPKETQQVILEPRKPDSVSVSVNVNDSVSDTVIVKKKDGRDFIPPLLTEFKEYFIENKFSIDLAERAWKGYDAAEWKDSKGNKIKNWKQKCQHVWFNDQNKIQNGKQNTNTLKSNNGIVTPKNYGKL